MAKNLDMLSPNNEGQNPSTLYDTSSLLRGSGLNSVDSNNQAQWRTHASLGEGLISSRVDTGKHM